MTGIPGTAGAARDRRQVSALLPGTGVFGGVRRFFALGNELVRRGHRYTLYTPEGRPPGWMRFDGEVRPLAALQSSQHDVLLCGEPSLVPHFDAAAANLKLFYCVLEGFPGERQLARRRDWVWLANSAGIAARLQRRYRLPTERVAGGIDLDLFQPAAGAPHARPERPLRVLAYGRFSRARKGTRLVVRAAESLARRAAGGPQTADPAGPPVQLVLFDHVGPGNETDPREGFRCGIPYEFHINLPQTALANLYASCDLFVSAEKRAGWNNTVAEAMACGVPVVCTPSGTRDLALHLETAWVLRARHSFFITRAMNALRQDPALRDRLRRNALARVSGFSWPRVADQFEAVLGKYPVSPAARAADFPGSL